MPSRWSPLAGALAAVALTGQARAQAFRAEIHDATSGLPVAGALLQIKDPSGAVLAEKLTDPDGLVTGRVYAGATVIFMVRRIGYRPFISDLVVLPDTGTSVLRFGLESGAYELPELETRATRASILDRTGFTDRSRSGFGHFVDPETIDARRRSAFRVADFVMTVPGVTIVPTVRGGSAIRFTGMGSLSARCGTPRVFIDGMQVTADELDDVVQPLDVLAIEVYRRPAEIPARFGGSESGCGVIAIWSRRGPR
jgi:hypothetical protein